MRNQNRHLFASVLIAITCLLALMTLIAQPDPGARLGQQLHAIFDPLFGKHETALAFAESGATIELGDDDISDDHVDFEDRGRHPHQDWVCGPNCAAGAVNTVHGNLIYTRQDIYIPGRGLPLEIYFTYNSGSFFDGRYGYGWQMNYNIRYITNDVNDNIIIVREDDRTDIFVKQSDGSFQATYAVRDILTEPVPGQYLLTDRDGVQYWFDDPTHHYVTKIEDLNGNTLTLTYDGAKALQAVTDSAGRQLTFTYTANKLTVISDPLGRVFQYEYDNNGNMISTTNPLSHTTLYSYSLTCHDLVSITDARDNVFSITYNSDYQVKELSSCCGGTTFAYNRIGRTTTVTDGNGHATVYGYDAKNRVTTIQDTQDGNTTRTWDVSYNLTSVTDANERTTTYTYDSRGNLLTQTDALDQVTTYLWHSSLNKVLSVTNPAGHTITYTYDLQGNLVGRKDPRGELTTYEYDSYGQVITRTSPTGDITTYSYDPVGNRLSETDALGYISAYSYDPVGNRISATDANGNITTYSYDPLNRLVVITNTLGYTTTYSYDSLGNRISETDANNNITTYSYDPLNRLVVITDTLGYTITYSYDPVGNRISQTDANGNSTAYSYDSLNRLVVITDALGYISNYSYDPVGNRISATDANGNITTYSYDALNRLVVITDALGYVSNYSYDPVGNRISETDANTHTISYSYDSLNRLVVITNALGYTTTYSYDSVGNLISETDANGNITTYSYDALNRLVVITDTLGYAITYSYDPVGNRISETDANTHTISYSYDSLNRLVVITNALGYTTTYSYDPVGNRISETDANHHRWDYEYDDMNRCITGTSPMGHATTYTYDGVGNRISRLDPNGDRTDYSYDGLDRRIAITYPGGITNVNYSYDAVGNLLALTNTGGLSETVQRTYDSLDRLTEETIYFGPLGHFTKTVSYTYDNNGNISILSGPDTYNLTYEYDAMNRLINAVDASGATPIAYDAAGRGTGMTYTNGAQTAYTYDNINRLTNITTHDVASSLMFQYDYIYDPVGQVQHVLRDGLIEAEYQYNAAGWLTDAVHPSLLVSYSYTYDSVGNRLTQNKSGNVTSYDYNDEDRVLTQTLPGPNPIRYDYDSNGNVIQTTSAAYKRQYMYDFENRLIGIQEIKPTSGTITIYYSSEGIQLARNENGQWSYFYPTLVGVVVEMDSAGQVLTHINPEINFRDLTAGPDIARGTGPGGTTTYIHHDGRNSTTNFTDNSATGVATFTFGYFGEMLGSAGDIEEVDAGLYASDLKVDWDPMLGAELIGGDYAPDIDQPFGAPHFDPDEEGLYPYDPGGGLYLPDPDPPTFPEDAGLVMYWDNPNPDPAPNPSDVTRSQAAGKKSSTDNVPSQCACQCNCKARIARIRIPPPKGIIVIWGSRWRLEPRGTFNCTPKPPCTESVVFAWIITDFTRVRGVPMPGSPKGGPVRIGGSTEVEVYPNSRTFTTINLKATVTCSDGKTCSCSDTIHFNPADPPLGGWTSGSYP